MRTKGEIANTGFLQQLDDHMRKKEISIKESAEESRRRMTIKDKDIRYNIYIT